MSESKKLLAEIRLQSRPILYWLHSWSHFLRVYRDAKRVDKHLLGLKLQLLSEGKEVEMPEYDTLYHALFASCMMHDWSEFLRRSETAVASDNSSSNKPFTTVLSLNIKLTCGHDHVGRLINIQALSFQSDSMEYVKQLIAISSSMSSTWNDVLSHKFQACSFLSDKVIRCSTCNTNNNKTISMVRKINRINETFTLTLSRYTREYHGVPLIIIPTLTLLPYCEPQLVQDLTKKGALKYVPELVTALTTSSISIPHVLINIISEYAVTPAQYCLQAIFVNDDNDNCKSVLIKKQNTISNEDEWWFISGSNDNKPQRVNSEDIFTTDAIHKPIVDYPLPLTHATVLRYQLID